MEIIDIEIIHKRMEIIDIQIIYICMCVCVCVCKLTLRMENFVCEGVVVNYSLS